ncbi:NAD(P)/FAD-dependent oxidoreductase [Streptomyces scabiei]|uniref:NAD(P)/FAD-dependent oxidoreductase n=1 Tax=Streptomyces scabiei TaxID=1930 RepID=UPI00056D54E9|nr:NAD(P)/FAD-dependent oxidoreductase [Streptomyces scabiei]
MSRPRIVIVGGGFAGYRTARTLARLTRSKADITLLNPTDYFLYLPLLPQVAAGILEPRRVTVSLTGTLRHVRLVLGEADDIDLDARTVRYADPEGGVGTLTYDRLVLAAGSVNKLLPIPGVAEHAHGFRGLPEALYLRDHVTRQVELAAGSDDPESRRARCTFVVVGAGYTGTEVAAQGQMFTDALVRKQPLPDGTRPRWILLDIAERVLPEMDEKLSRTADKVLRQRGVDVRMGASVKEATSTGVLLSDGEFVDTRTLVWCVGVRPDPLAESLGLAMERGRLLVEPTLRVPGRPEVFACGDAAAVPDLTRPGQYTPMTAQHAWRQGKVAGHNVAASLGRGEPKPYRHSDLGFVVDLGGVKAAANPLGVPLSGPLAGAVTRGYHLAAMPGNRVRVAADWLLDAVLPRQGVQLGLVRSWSVPLDTASPELAKVPGGPERTGAARERAVPERAGTSDGPGAALEQDAPNRQDDPTKQDAPNRQGAPTKQDAPNRQGAPTKQDAPNKQDALHKRNVPDRPGTTAVPGTHGQPHASPPPAASDTSAPGAERQPPLPSPSPRPKPQAPPRRPAPQDPSKPAKGSEGES